jgi:hypothetical protein
MLGNAPNSVSHRFYTDPRRFDARTLNRFSRLTIIGSMMHQTRFMNSNCDNVIMLANPARILALALCVASCLFAPCALAQGQTGSSADGGKSGSTTDDVKQKIQENGQAAVEKAQTLWQRIDERRLKNRTRDEIVASVIMGLLAGGLLFRFGRGGQLSSIAYGLSGALVGGIVANVTQLNLGLGPVLVTYEDLLFTLLGALLMPFGLRWLAAKLSKSLRHKPA